MWLRALAKPNYLTSLIIMKMGKEEEKKKERKRERAREREKERKMRRKKEGNNKQSITFVFRRINM